MAIKVNTKNVFYQNRMKIKAISEKEHVDAGVATSMFANQAKISNPAAMNEWMDIMRKYQQDPKLTLADLFK